jgi:hypothetical protein
MIPLHIGKIHSGNGFLFCEGGEFGEFAEDAMQDTGESKLLDAA